MNTKFHIYISSVLLRPLGTITNIFKLRRLDPFMTYLCLFWIPMIMYDAMGEMDALTKYLELGILDLMLMNISVSGVDRLDTSRGIVPTEAVAAHSAQYSVTSVTRRDTLPAIVPTKTR